jgi:hypothetical protein
VALKERTPFKHYTGHTPNIAALCTYILYSYGWLLDSEQVFPNQQRVIGRWLGISHDIGGPLTYFILPKSCKPIAQSSVIRGPLTYFILPKSCRPIARSSITPMTPEELLEPANKALAEELDKAINEKIGKFRTDKEVAEEPGTLIGPSGDL